MHANNIKKDLTITYTIWLWLPKLADVSNFFASLHCLPALLMHFNLSFLFIRLFCNFQYLRKSKNSSSISCMIQRHHTIYSTTVIQLLSIWKHVFLFTSGEITSDITGLILKWKYFRCINFVHSDKKRYTLKERTTSIKMSKVYIKKCPETLLAWGFKINFYFRFCEREKRKKRSCDCS